MSKELVSELIRMKTYYLTLVKSCDNIINYYKGESEFEKKDELRSITISKFDLSARTRNILSKHHEHLGISDIHRVDITLNELSNISLNKLKQCYGCGKAIIYDINQLCRENGIKLQP